MSRCKNLPNTMLSWRSAFLSITKFPSILNIGANTVIESIHITRSTTFFSPIDTSNANTASAKSPKIRAVYIFNNSVIKLPVTIIANGAAIATAQSWKTSFRICLSDRCMSNFSIFNSKNHISRCTTYSVMTDNNSSSFSFVQQRKKFFFSLLIEKICWFIK